MISKSQKIATFVKALFKHAKNGFKVVPNATYIRRVSTCLECPKYKAEDDTCGVCGCYIDKKALWDSESCPDNRWKYENK